MSCINHVPAYAKAQATSFMNTGSIKGEGVQTIPVPQDQVAQVEEQLTSQLDQLIAMDNVNGIDTNPEVGVVSINQQGVNATAHFQGNTDEGCVSLEATGMMDTAALGQFSAESANVVQVLDLGNGEYATVGAHIDRAGGKSYIQMHNVPDGFNIFG